MTNDKKIEKVIEHLTESHLETHGGYAYDYQWIGEYLVVAGLDDAKERNRTKIDTYHRGNIIAWYDRAEAFLKDNPVHLSDALFETE